MLRKRRLQETVIAAVGFILGTSCILVIGIACSNGAAPGPGSGLYGGEAEGAFWSDAPDIDALDAILPADISAESSMEALIGKIDASCCRWGFALRLA